MIKLENYEAMGWEYAIRGMRNPMNSWEKSDSGWYNGWVSNSNMTVHECGDCDEYQIGPNDRSLMMTLRNAGTDHRKFMRMITVYVDIVAPLYWWKEFSTYKVGTVENSCSTMHKIANKEFTLEDFSCEHLSEVSTQVLEEVIFQLNKYRDLYLSDPNTVLSYFSEDEQNHDIEQLRKDIWWQMIQLLPSSYNQRRTVMLNYEVLANIYKSRKYHKLDEWIDFCKWIETLPYSELITGDKND